MNTLKQLPELTALVEAGQNPFNQVLMDYVDQGGKTVGFMYQDTPEEIITAAGAAPIYLRGTTSEGTEMAEAFFRQLTCNYTKHTYNEILDGKWDFLDGAVLSPLVLGCCFFANFLCCLASCLCLLFKCLLPLILIPLDSVRRSLTPQSQPHNASCAFSLCVPS